MLAADLAVSLIATWVLGLAPALVARYVWKKRPLSAWHATLIAGISCAIFAVAFLVIRSALDEANARISLAWILVFLVSRAIMMSGKRAELVRRLQVMIADPATTGEHRALATEKLSQLEAATAKGVRALHLERGQPDVHPQRLVQCGDESGDVEGGDFVAARARMQRSGRAVAYTFGCVLLLDLLLIISGYRILVGEKVVPAGERYQTAEWVHGSDDGSTIVCWYWTGRSVKEISHWYGQRGQQIDECRFIFDPSEVA